MRQCPLCREQSANWPEPTSRSLDVNCTNCGSFRITTTTFEALQGIDAIAFYLGSWVYEQNWLGSAPLINRDTLEFIKTYPCPDTKKRAELYLGRAISLLDNKLTGRIQIGDPRLRVASWSFFRDDTAALANYLLQLGAFEHVDSSQEYRLVAKAHILYGEMAQRRAASSQAFVAMWFGPEMKEAYDSGFKVAIDGSGYNPLRVDRKEHERKIDDEIIAEIRRSAFVIVTSPSIAVGFITRPDSLMDLADG